MSATLLAAALAAPAALRGQVVPAWDPGRHVLVVVSGLDSADAYPAVVRAFEAEGLHVEHSDTARGRIICAPRPSDSYGASQATVQYLGLIHRAAHGGSEIWLGAMLQTVGQNDPSSFAKVPTSLSNHQRIEGDIVFIGPRSGSREWDRLQRIGDAIAHVTH